MELLIVLKILFLFIGFLYGTSIAMRYFRGLSVDGFRMLVMAVGIVGFIVLQFGLYQ